MSTFNEWRWLPTRWYEERYIGDGPEYRLWTGVRWLRWDFWVREKPAA